jgi:hypothetical protein
MKLSASFKGHLWGFQIVTLVVKPITVVQKRRKEKNSTVRTMNGKEVQLSSSDNGTNKKQAMYN